MSTNNFINPYRSEPKDAVMRTTFVLTTKDVSKLRAWEPKEGVIQTTLAILLKKLIHELERIQLRAGDRYGYQHLVATARISVGAIESGSTVTKPASRSKRAKSNEAIG